jgi:hypothetical protein
MTILSNLSRLARSAAVAAAVFSPAAALADVIIVPAPAFSIGHTFPGGPFIGHTVSPRPIPFPMPMPFPAPVFAPSYGPITIVGGSCARSHLDPLVGRHRTAANVLRDHMPVRVFTPNSQARTLDYNPRRANIDTVGGMITDVYCG